MAMRQVWNQPSELICRSRPTSGPAIAGQVPGGEAVPEWSQGTSPQIEGSIKGMLERGRAKVVLRHGSGRHEGLGLTLDVLDT